jgi:hypothetical protein
MMPAILRRSPVALTATALASVLAFAAASAAPDSDPSDATDTAAAAGTAFLLGLIKEWLDPRFDRADLFADAVGAALAAWATHALKP